MNIKEVGASQRSCLSEELAKHICLFLLQQKLLVTKVKFEKKTMPKSCNYLKDSTPICSWKQKSSHCHSCYTSSHRCWEKPITSGDNATANKHFDPPLKKLLNQSDTKELLRFWNFTCLFIWKILVACWIDSRCPECEFDTMEENNIEDHAF